MTLQHTARRPSRTEAPRPLGPLDEDDLLNSRGVVTSPNRQISHESSNGIKELSVMSSRTLISRQKLNQEVWSPEEVARKEAVIPLLTPSLDLLSQSEPGIFGQIFYQNVFQNPEHAKALKPLFAGKDMERTTNAFGRIPCEMLRLLMLPSKALMTLETLSLALRHVDYGAKREHNEVFGNSFLRALSQFLIREGGVWDSDISDGWAWVYTTFSDELLRALETVRPKVEAVRSSWNQIITKTLMQSELSSDSRISGSGRRHSVSGRTLASIHGTRVMVNGGSSTKHAKKRNMLNAEMVEEDGADGHQRAVVSVGAAMAQRLQEGMAQSKEQAKFAWSEKHGQKLGTALELVVSTATRPKELERHLFKLAQRHVELGVKPAHLKVFESCLLDLLEASLSAAALENAQPAWKWLWDIVERTFVDVLANWETMQTSLTASWDAVAKYEDTAVKLARSFHNTLLDRVMVFRTMFKKRDEALALVFAKALQLLVACVHDSSLIETELEKISVMHCKFDLQAWHFEIFGQILLETLAQFGGQAWCDDYTEAWSMLYGMASQTFLEAIEGSRTSLCSALLQGSSKKVKEALSKAPRGDRAASALQVGVGRRQLSPLLWALRDMHLEVLEILLSDILTIRADRQCFYYGVDDLWKRCPAILDALVEFAPHLLEPLLDGHMWVSRETTDGLRRVNLWVQYIYGNPEELEHVFAGPLGTLVERLPETHIEVFRHPVIAETVNLKWHQFGRRRLIVVSLQQITCLVSYLVVSMVQDLPLWLLLCACTLWGTITTIQLAHGCYIAAWEACTQRCVSLDFKLCHLKVPRSLCQFFVQLRLVCCLLSLVVIVAMMLPCFDESSTLDCLDGDRAAPRVLSASVAFLQWIQMAELFKLHGKMAAVVLLGKAMMEDALRFMMGLGLWLIAVGASLHKLQDEENRPENGFSSAYNLFAHVLGVGTETDMSYYGTGQVIDTIIRAVYLGALWVSVVPILNVLVAAMVSTYSKAESMTLGLAIKARAAFVLRMEDMLRFKRRLHYFKEAGFDVALAFSEHDRGPSGGISMMCDTLQLKEHGSFARRVGTVLFFAGETGAEQPWPAHDIPVLCDMVDTSTERLPSQELHQQLLSELRVIRDATTRDRVNGGKALPEPSAASRHVELSLETLAALAEATAGHHCFLAIEGRVYDVGAYLPKHPGGSGVLESGRGSDVSELFRTAHSQLPRARAALAELPVLGTLPYNAAPLESAGNKVFV
ncbi:vhb [Symbiodinium natans]|uniref:Vhb protein n=1 Tax=Symbiodinium natans TaxID=878477 RepID=A0A812UCW0_9DINO|nr:vhb [Symbiodinium natans]